MRVVVFLDAMHFALLSFFEMSLVLVSDLEKSWAGRTVRSCPALSIVYDQEQHKGCTQ